MNIRKRIILSIFMLLVVTYFVLGAYGRIQWKKGIYILPFEIEFTIGDAEGKAPIVMIVVGDKYLKRLENGTLEMEIKSNGIWNKTDYQIKSTKVYDNYYMLVVDVECDADTEYTELKIWDQEEKVQWSVDGSLILHWEEMTDKVSCYLQINALDKQLTILVGIENDTEEAVWIEPAQPVLFKEKPVKMRKTAIYALDAQQINLTDTLEDKEGYWLGSGKKIMYLSEVDMSEDLFINCVKYPAIKSSEGVCEVTFMHYNFLQDWTDAQVIEWIASYQ